jgi:hypothetical protein
MIETKRSLNRAPLLILFSIFQFGILGAKNQDSAFKNQLNVIINTPLQLLATDNNEGVNINTGIFYFHKLNKGLHLRAGAVYRNQTSWPLDGYFRRNDYILEAGAHYQFGKRNFKWYAGLDAGAGETKMHASQRATGAIYNMADWSQPYALIAPVLGSYFSIGKHWTLGAEFDLPIQYGPYLYTYYEYDGRNLSSYNFETGRSRYRLRLSDRLLPFDRVFAGFKF